MSRALLPLRLESVWVAIDALGVREVLGQRPWVPIPGATVALPGVIAWKGRAVAVVDLGAIAGLSAPVSQAEPRERCVVVQLGAATFALMVDAVREVHTAQDEQFLPVQATRQAFASAEIHLGGVPVPVLDLARVVSSLCEHPVGKGP